MVFQVCQRNEIAKQEGIAIVIVFNIQRRAHTMWQPWLRCKPFWQTFNKAKDTFISTLADKRRWLLTEQNTQIFISALSNAYLALILLALKTNHQLFVGNIEAIIDQITNYMTINGTNQIARL